MAEMRRLQEEIGLSRLFTVGDRGMPAARAWQLQLGVFDERNLLEPSSPDYPGERLVACRNPELARLRAQQIRV